MTNKPTPASQPNPAQQLVNVGDKLTALHADVDAFGAELDATIAAHPEWVEQPSPARSDKEAERSKPWTQVNAEAIAAQDLLDWNRSQAKRPIEVTKELGVARKAFEFLAAANAIVAAQSPAGQAQESAPSGEGIDTPEFDALLDDYAANFSADDKWQSADTAAERASSRAALVAHIGAALARRATAGNAAPTEVARQIVGVEDKLHALHADVDTFSAELDATIAAHPEWCSKAATAAPGDLPPLPWDDSEPHRNNRFVVRVGDLSDAMREYGRACIASNAGAAIPEGFALVPDEPTDEQWRAGIDAWNDAHGTPAGEDELPNVIYRAMLAAAPVVVET